MPLCIPDTGKKSYSEADRRKRRSSRGTRQASLITPRVAISRIQISNHRTLLPRSFFFFFPSFFLFSRPSRCLPTFFESRAPNFTSSLESSQLKNKDSRIKFLIKFKRVNLSMLSLTK